VAAHDDARQMVWGMMAGNGAPLRVHCAWKQHQQRKR
jgi:hypothetical protein